MVTTKVTKKPLDVSGKVPSCYLLFAASLQYDCHWCYRIIQRFQLKNKTNLILNSHAFYFTSTNGKHWVTDNTKEDDH